MRILVVEDEYSLAEILKEALVKYNYLVDISYDGQDGLDQALTDIYDVILLDVMLPKMNGFEVLKEVRKSKIMTPIIMLTAKSEIQDKLNGLENGADDYLTKPFNIQELIARVKTVSRRNGDIILNNLTYNDIELDSRKCEIKCLINGKSIKVGTKEFALLEFLIKNQNGVLSKEQIYEKIWGYESDSEYNNVEVYVSFIRKKLLFINSNTKIKAIRNIGYVLEKEND